MNNTVAVAQDRILPFEFRGKAREYFSIWIVNIALTIVTLGVYSAWAKVRTNQYFYGNTFLDDASFRYLASPVQILKGRIIAFVLFLAYYFSGLISTTASVITLAVLMLLFPALLVMSMAFKLRNSAWKNVRFDFNKDFKKAYLLFTLPALLVGGYVAVTFLMLPTSGQPMTEAEAQQLQNIPMAVFFIPLLFPILFPLFEYLVVRFLVSQSRYGDGVFDFHAGAGGFYSMYMLAGLVFAVVGIIYGLVVGGLSAGLIAMLGEESAAGFLGMLISLLMMLPLYLWIFAYINTKKTNLIYSNIRIDGHELGSELKVMEMFKLYVTNTLGILLSLGLLMPWAKVRTARYRASRTRLTAMDDMNDYVNAQRQRQSAFGEEMGEMFDMDLGF